MWPNPVDFLASRPFVVRSARHYCTETLDQLTRPGHLYRGMSEAEWSSVQTSGIIQSDARYSFCEEGTCFASDAGTAEDFANFGRTDPRKTGRASYLVEIVKTPSIEMSPDGYWKTRLPIPRASITRAWRMTGRGSEIVAQRVV